MIKFSYTILYVADVAKTVQFYSEAFGFECRFMTEEHDYAEMITGSTTLAFASLELATSNLSLGFKKASIDEQAGAIEIGFVVADVALVIEAVKAAGGNCYEPLRTKPWGQDVAYVRDLDGHLIEVCTAMSH